MSDQLSVPVQQGFGVTIGHLGQKLASDSHDSGGQPTALVIVEPQTPLAELFAKNTVTHRSVYRACSPPVGMRNQSRLYGK